MTSAIANRLSADTREQLKRIRNRPPRRTRDAQKAEREAEFAATLLYLQTQGWKTHEGMSVAQCPRCAAVATTFVSRALREGGPRVLRCVDGTCQAE
jgi:exoribonuclease R